MDLRIQKTKNSIFSAFIELRAAKPLEKITIRELTQKANISKQTFYLHFKDIYDLSEYLENDAITSLVADIPNPDLIITDPAAAARLLCTAFITQGHLFNILFPDDDRSCGVLTNKLEARIKELIFITHPEFKDNLEKNITISLLIQGSVHTFLKYKEEDCRPFLIIPRTFLCINGQNKHKCNKCVLWIIYIDHILICHMKQFL